MEPPSPIEAAAAAAPTEQRPLDVAPSRKRKREGKRKADGAGARAKSGGGGGSKKSKKAQEAETRRAAQANEEAEAEADAGRREREFIDALRSHVPDQAYRDPAFMTRVKHADPAGWWSPNGMRVVPSDWLASDVAPLMDELLKGNECFTNIALTCSAMASVNADGHAQALGACEEAVWGAAQQCNAVGLADEGASLAAVQGSLKNAREALAMMCEISRGIGQQAQQAIAQERAFRMAMAAKLRDVMRSGRATIVHHDMLPVSMFHHRTVEKKKKKGKGK
jgi:hypothetical protein